MTDVQVSNVLINNGETTMEYTIDSYLNRIGRECENVLNSIDIPCGTILTYIVESGEAWGHCHHITGRLFVISINKLLIDKKNETGLRNTIIHELLHTCPECYNHGREWVNLTKKIKRLLGITVNEKSTYHDLGIDIADYINTRSYKYVIQCKECGECYFRKRKSDFVINYDKYRCRKCGGDFIRIFPEE